MSEFIVKAMSDLYSNVSFGGGGGGGGGGRSSRAPTTSPRPQARPASITNSNSSGGTIQQASLAATIGAAGCIAGGLLAVQSGASPRSAAATAALCVGGFLS